MKDVIKLLADGEIKEAKYAKLTVDSKVFFPDRYAREFFDTVYQCIEEDNVIDKYKDTDVTFALIIGVDGEYITIDRPFEIPNAFIQFTISSSDIYDHKASILNYILLLIDLLDTDIIAQSMGGAGEKVVIRDIDDLDTITNQYRLLRDWDDGHFLLAPYKHDKVYLNEEINASDWFFLTHNYSVLTTDNDYTLYDKVL